MNNRERFRTINELSPERQVEAKQRYIDRNYYTIRKHIGFFSRERLKGSFIGTLFQGRIESRFGSEGFLVRSTCCYSRTGIYIPVQLEVVTYAFMESNLKVDGIFRVNSVQSILQSFQETIGKVVSGEEGLDAIRSEFDVLDIAESYKAMFKIFDPPIIPASFAWMAMTISDIDDTEEKKICAKAFVYGLPSQNRQLLENCVFVCNYLHKDLEAQKNTKQMNLMGISMSMMPNLFKPRQYVNDVGTLQKLSNFLLFVFRHYRYIFSLE